MVGPMRCTAGHGLWLILVLAGLMAAAPSAGAQTTESPRALAADGPPEWTVAWSPLATLADLPRELPDQAVTFPDLLTFPAPRVGLFWTAGNPGALPFEVADSRVRFRAGLLSASGDYRRPLDPGSLSRHRASALGWRPVGAGAVVGRVIVDRSNLKEQAFAEVPQPYGSNPYIVLDTIGDELRRTATLAEGAGGWRLGRLGLGLALGWEGGETRTPTSPVPRLNRSAGPAFGGGIAYELAGDGWLRLGASGRWRRTVQYIQIYLTAAPTRIYQLEGYADPVPFDIQTIYTRRLERDAWEVGLSLAGRAFGGEWALFGRIEDTYEGQHNMQSNDPPKDSWKAEGWTAGGAFQRSLYRDRWLVTASARYTELDGKARRHDLGAVTFTADEKRLAADVELRLSGLRGWEAAGRLSLVRDDRIRRDLLGRTRSEIRSWEPGVAVEVVRTLGERFALSAGGALAGYSPSGGVPLATAMGPVYQEFVAPELAVHATGGQLIKGRLAGRWQATGGAAFWVQASYASLTPKQGAIIIPRQPDGKRSGWTLDVGASLTGAP